MTDDGPILGMILETQPGGRVNVRVVGADEVPLQSDIANAHMRLLLAEAIKVGVRPPAWFIFGSAQIFYQRGRPVEARMSGATRKVAHYTDDGQPVWLFPPWSTDSAPRWSEDGGMMPEDARRTYQAARNQAVERDGELQPVLRRWWNLHEHSPRSFVFWRDLADLAESEDEFPSAAQGVARALLEKMRDEPSAAYALSEAGAPWQHKLVKGIKARLIELRQAAGMDGEAPPMDDAGAEVTRKASAWMATTFPDGGSASAEDLRKRATPEPWAPWWPEDGQNFAFVLRVLALLVWRNEVEAEADRDRTAPLVIEAASASIGGYGGIPRVAAPMSWAFGGPGISAATVNGDSYALEPEAAASALVPRSFMLTGSVKQPERFNMPLELDPPMPLAIQVTDATGYALTPHAGKLALIVMAHDRAMGGKVYRWTLDALVKSLNPGGRRIESRHFKPVAEGLEQLKKLHAFLPTGQKYQVFYATGLLTDPSTAHARKDAEVVLGIDPVFSAMTREWGGAKGYFLINLDGAMRLDNREPVSLRTYVRVAALWNTTFKPGGEPDPERMKPTRIDEIGLMANNYRHGTVELLQAQGERNQAKRARMALSEDREKTRDTLRKLAGEGLLTLKETDATGARVGKHELVILPPDEYVEAWRRHRSPKG
mgnify:CR=1 FL=1|jgi:hypothetical protein